MSGGSFNYLYVWRDDAAEILNRMNDLEDMARALEKDFPGTDAARDTRQLIEVIGHYSREIERRADHLGVVWHAIEWWHSNDYGRDTATEAVTQYETDKIAARRRDSEAKFRGA